MLKPVPMTRPSQLKLQSSVFGLVSAAFLNIYITQPVLPILQREFGADMVTVSLSVSAVVLGIAISTLPFGYIADRWSIRPIIFMGALLVALNGLVCAATRHIWILIGARLCQGLFIPALTTCLAAYLAKTLPAERLNVVMGSYISATVLGGLGGRLLGGWIHPPLHWRYAFVSAAAITLLATIAALINMPPSPRPKQPVAQAANFRSLVRRWPLLRIFLCAAGSFAIFSSIFNYLPFRLAGPPFHYPTQHITLLYLVYVTGIFMGPVAGRISNRFGNGHTLVAGALVLAASLALLLCHTITMIVIGLIGVCGGFFGVHASAVGALNRKLSSGQGRANALYVLFYYVGGWVGITASGWAYQFGGWRAVVMVGWCLLIIPISTGIMERKETPA